MSYASKQHHGAEAKLALGLQQHLKSQGYTCYPELDRVDLVAKKGDEVLAIECKKQIDLKVFAQAWQHRRKATGIYVAFPSRDYYRQDTWGCAHFVRDMAMQMGIGIFTVGYDYREAEAWRTWKPGEPIPSAKVTMQYPSKVCERQLKHWDKLMVPEGENYSVAGGSGVKAWTEIRIWELEVKKWIHENPGKTVREILLALRPPGTHKKTGKPLVVQKQHQERLFYFIKHVFTGFHIEDIGGDFSTSQIWISDDYYARPLQEENK